MVPAPLSRSEMTRFSCFASIVWNVPLARTLRREDGKARKSVQTWSLLAVRFFFFP
jgi:hypothetical protein